MKLFDKFKESKTVVYFNESNSKCQENMEKFDTLKTLSSNITPSSGENISGSTNNLNPSVTSTFKLVDHPKQSLSGFNFNTASESSPATSNFNFKINSTEPALTSAAYSTFKFANNSVSIPKLQFTVNPTSKETSSSVTGLPDFTSAAKPIPKSTGSTTTPSFGFTASETSSKTNVQFESDVSKNSIKTDANVSGSQSISVSENKAVSNSVSSGSAFNFSFGSGSQFTTSTIPSTGSNTETTNFQLKLSKPSSFLASAKGTVSDNLNNNSAEILPNTHRVNADNFSSIPSENTNFSLGTALTEPYQSTDKDNLTSPNTNVQLPSFSLSSTSGDLKFQDSTKNDKNSSQSVHSLTTDKPIAKVTTSTQTFGTNTPSTDPHIFTADSLTVQSSGMNLPITTTSAKIASVITSTSSNSDGSTGFTPENALQTSVTMASTTSTVEKPKGNQFNQVLL